MPKIRELPDDFDVLEAWEELFVLLEATNKDLRKAVTKGTKQPGVRARKALRTAQGLISDIIHGSITKQKAIWATRPPHGNANGPGIKAMQEARRRKLEEKRRQEAEQSD